MGYKNPDEQRKYQAAWLQARRDEWIKLHGPCQNCGSSENLEIDHIDPATKEFNPSAIWSWSAERRNAELAKCQVLCRGCHLAKTLKERPPAEHGVWFYQKYGCRCEICVGAKLYSYRNQKSQRAIRRVKLQGVALAR